MTCGWSGCRETKYQEVANKFFDNWITLGILLETGCEYDKNKCNGNGKNSALCTIGKNIYENVEKNGLKLNQVLNFIINNTNNYTPDLCAPLGVHFNSNYPKKAPQISNGSTNIDSNIAYVFVLFEDEIKEYMNNYPVEKCRLLSRDCKIRNKQKNNFNTSLTELSGAMKGWAKELINGRNDTREGSNFLNKWKNNENSYLTLNNDSIQVEYEKLKKDIETYETNQKERKKRRNKGGKKTIRKRSKSIRKRTNKKKKRKKKKKRNATKNKRTKKRR